MTETMNTIEPSIEESIENTEIPVDESTENTEQIEHDPSLGEWRTYTKIVPNGKPIDNVTKFAYDDDEYVKVTEWHEYTEQELAEREAQAAEAQAKEQRETFLQTAPTRLEGVEGQMQALTSAFGGVE